MKELNLTRGKPAPEQLDLSNKLIDILQNNEYQTTDGFDCRNYGLPYGIEELRLLFGEMLGVDPQCVLVPAPASLELMYDTVLFALQRELPGGKEPWCRTTQRKWLCPIPGYDRHFAITENLGFELIPITMDDEGPVIGDIQDALDQYGTEIKGMWTVPVYSNPTGITYSEQRLHDLFSLNWPADFRMLCDMAYIEHHLGSERHTVPNLLQLAAQLDKPNLCILYASMSKITYPGSSAAAIASSPANIAWYQQHLKYRQIGTDKMTQLRHHKLFPNLQSLREHMARQADILRPKFNAVSEVFEERLSGIDNVSWTSPAGGYFIGLSLPEHTAKAVVDYCQTRGLSLTPAGSPFPYGINPQDNFLRIAPSFPPLEEVREAAQIVAEAVIKVIEKTNE